jgi:hypothetical protein
VPGRDPARRPPLAHHGQRRVPAPRHPRCAHGRASGSPPASAWSTPGQQRLLPCRTYTAPSPCRAGGRSKRDGDGGGRQGSLRCRCPAHQSRPIRRPGRGLRRVARPPGELGPGDAAGRPPRTRSGPLPPYLLNPDVFLDGTLLGSPDAWFVGLGLGDEVDSREWHEEVDALDATLLRHERFTGAGLHLNHGTPGRFRSNPRAHLDKLARLVDERKALSVPEPPGLVVLGRGPLLPARTPWPQTSRRP